MVFIRKTLAVACAVSVLGLGVAVAQTADPTAPTAPAGGAMTAPAGGAMTAPAGGDVAAPAEDAAMPKKHMTKKKMTKKHVTKKMMKKKAM